MAKKNIVYTLNMFSMLGEPEQMRFVRWTVLYGLATRRHITQHIDKIYASNRIEYYQAFKNSEYADINLSLFTTDTIDMLIKVGGIMAWAHREKDHRSVFSLIEKGYKFAWNFLKRHKRMNLPDFYNGMKKIVHPDEANFQAVMGVYVSSIQGYDVVVDIYQSDEDVQNAIESSSIAMGNIIKFAETNFEIMVRESEFGLAELDEEAKGYLRELSERWDVKPQAKLSLMTFIKDLKDREIKEMGVDQFRGREYADQLDKATTEVMFSGKSRLFTILKLWLEIEGISWYDLFENYELTRKEYEKAAYFLQRGKEKGLIHEGEEDLIFSYTLILSALNDSYLKAKTAQIDNRAEEMEFKAQKQVRELTEKWQEREKGWKEEVRIHNEGLKAAREEVRRLEALVKEQRKEMASQEAELDKVRQSRKELDAMVRYQQLQEVEDESGATVPLEDMMEFLRDKQLVVIGGHPSWQAKLMEKLPHLTAWEAGDVNRDLTPLDHADAVFIYWTYLSHPMYWKVKSRMSQNDTNLFFIDRTTNLEKTVAQIYWLMVKDK